MSDNKQEPAGGYAIPPDMMFGPTRGSARHEPIETGIRDGEGLGVDIMQDDSGRLVVVAYNEAGFNFTSVDLLDVIAWVKANRPELL